MQQTRCWWLSKSVVPCALAAQIFMSGCATNEPLGVQSARMAPAAPVAVAQGASALLYLMGDNQERELFGQPTRYSEIIAQRLSNVAIRSVEQDLYSKFVAQYVVDDIAQRQAKGEPMPTLLHLGDLLDYGCSSEFEKLRRLSWPHTPGLYIAPGNHDVLFQGNASYGGFLGEIAVELLNLFAVDSTLDSHHNAVCRRHIGPVKSPMPDSVKAMRSWPQYAANQVERVNPIARELPHKFRCEYARMKAAQGLIANELVKRYCDDTLYFSYHTVKTVPAALPITPFNLDASSDERATAVMAGGNSMNNWNAGFLLQKIRLPIQLPGQSTSSRFVEIILLDTTDWSTRPSWAFWQVNSDAALGTIGPEQRRQVGDWIDASRKDPANLGVVFAGHYPVADLDPYSSDWLLRMQAMPGVIPLYLSAHTHKGFESFITVAGQNGQIAAESREINVGSLTDSPVHFRSLRLVWSEDKRELTALSEVQFLETTCSSTEAGRAALTRGHASAVAFSDASKPYVSDPRDQWCVRLDYTGRALSKRVPGFKGVDKDTCMSREVQKDRDALAPYLAAEDSLIALASTNATLRYELMCEAIGGARAFKFHNSEAKTTSFRFQLQSDRWAVAK